jgi:hypothetical protein
MKRQTNSMIRKMAALTLVTASLFSVTQPSSAYTDANKTTAAPDAASTVDKVPEVAAPPAFTWRPGDPIQFFDGKLVFDVQNRMRLELRNNTFDFNDSTNTQVDDTFLLQRFRIGALYKPNDWLKFYASAQDTRELFSEDRPDTPFVFASEGDNTFNLREAWVEVGNLANFPVSAKIGRQILSYGDERVIGSFDWNNFGRTFDAAKVSLQATQKITFDFFASSVVNVEGYEPFDQDHDWEFNESNLDTDRFYGIYMVDKNALVGFQQTEAYFLHRNKTENGPNYAATAGQTNFAYDLEQENFTVGARIKSTSTGRLKGFDYEADFNYQFGQGSLPGTGAGGRGLQNGLDLSAFAAHAAVGYNMELTPWTPRIGLDYAMATGDENPNDGTSESYMNLFHTNHKFYGYMDVLGWKNMHNPSFNITAKPNTKITLRMDYHAFFLFTNEDAWYRANAITAVRPVNAAARNADKFLGHEVDLTATYAYSKWLNFLVGYSHFFAGDYVGQTSPTGAKDDADFFYFQTVIRL